jgi:N-acyl-D-aspartate/D-glutamate deacylase
MDHLDKRLGINVGNLIGHTAVRHYVMRDDCQKAGATEAQLKQMQDVVRQGMEAGALGLSVSREKGHFDPQGVPIPALWADEKRSSRSPTCCARWAPARSSAAAASTSS